jgi:cytochrome c oxidase cbb3-type subunit 2
MIANASADALGQALPESTPADGVVGRYGEATNVRAFDGRPDRLTEMDALVAYLQILGGLTDLATVAEVQAEE